ncbi:SsrA-binding protein SmpB [Acidobacteria bacterium AH-259-O06]|nr:SsrA-binding protein SmpB [Acidobacteria bacterium AH-259-O06]
MAEQVVVKNKKAFHLYKILDRYEAGIALQGTEVKAIREHKVNLKDSYARIKDGELWLENCHISPYSHGSISNHEPLRSRKLLLHRRQINKMIGKSIKQGFTIVPLSLYFKNGKVKVEIALARGKQIHDKREAARRKAIEREVEMELRRRKS